MVDVFRIVDESGAWIIQGKLPEDGYEAARKINMAYGVADRALHRDPAAQKAFREFVGIESTEDFVDPVVTERMTPEGRDPVKRVIGSTSLTVQVFDAKTLRSLRKNQNPTH